MAAFISSPVCTRGTQLFVRRGAVTADSTITQPYPQFSNVLSKRVGLKICIFPKARPTSSSPAVNDTCSLAMMRVDCSFVCKTTGRFKGLKQVISQKHFSWSLLSLGWLETGLSSKTKKRFGVLDTTADFSSQRRPTSVNPGWPRAEPTQRAGPH